MIPYTVLPAEPFPSGPGGDDPTGPEPPAHCQGTPGGRVERWLGRWQGVPVWVEGRLEGPGRFVVERLITTDPDLFLWPALAPGNTLPLA